MPGNPLPGAGGRANAKTVGRPPAVRKIPPGSLVVFRKADLPRSQQDVFYSGDMYGMWECVLSVPCSYDFILTAPYFFPEGYTEELLTDLDRSLQAIEAKYELDKKQTDD